MKYDLVDWFIICECVIFVWLWIEILKGVL